MKKLPFIIFCFIMLCAFAAGMNSYHRTESMIANDVNRALETALQQMPGNVVTTDTIQCYRNSLNLAKANKLHSIAFPAISCGVYGYPNEEAVKIAAGEVSRWLEENGDYDIYVIFSCFSERMAELLVNVLNGEKTGSSTLKLIGEAIKIPFRGK